MSATKRAKQTKKNGHHQADGGRWRPLRALAWLMGLLLVMGALYQCIGQIRDDRMYPPPGRRINIGTHDQHYLHLHCVGSGSTTVVLESGLPFSSLTFDLVLRQAANEGLATNLTFCAYDRSGYGWSDMKSGPPPNISSTVDELHRLLEVAQVPAPYLFVGWSYGGIISELFSIRYPELVAGLVLVDTMLVNQTARIPEFSAQLEEGILAFKITRVAQWVGAFRLAGHLGFLPQEAGAPPSSLEEPLKSAMLASITKYNFPEAAFWELTTYRDSEAFLSKVLNERKKETRFDQALPVVSLAAVDEAMSVDQREDWIQVQKGEASRMSPLHYQLIVKSDHYVPLSAPASILRAVELCLGMRPRPAASAPAQDKTKAGEQGRQEEVVLANA